MIIMAELEVNRDLGLAELPGELWLINAAAAILQARERQTAEPSAFAIPSRNRCCPKVAP
jgi:hypothetical protein